MSADHHLLGEYSSGERTYQCEELDVLALDGITFPRVDVLKVDAEGHEEEVLMAAKRTILTHLPWIIMEVQHSDLKSRPVLMLKKWGYHSSKRIRGMGAPHKDATADWIFLPPQGSGL